MCMGKSCPSLILFFTILSLGDPNGHSSNSIFTNFRWTKLHISALSELKQPEEVQYVAAKHVYSLQLRTSIQLSASNTENFFDTQITVIFYNLLSRFFSITFYNFIYSNTPIYVFDVFLETVMWTEITYIGDAFPYTLFLCYESGTTFWTYILNLNNSTDKTI
jgi:hypothetical protein